MDTRTAYDKHCAPTGKAAQVDLCDFVLIPSSVTHLPVDLMVPLREGTGVSALFANTYGPTGQGRFVAITDGGQPVVRWDGQPRALTDADLVAVVTFVQGSGGFLADVRRCGDLPTYLAMMAGRNHTI